MYLWIRHVSMEHQNGRKTRGFVLSKIAISYPVIDSIFQSTIQAMIQSCRPIQIWSIVITDVHTDESAFSTAPSRFQYSLWHFGRHGVICRSVHHPEQCGASWFVSRGSKNPFYPFCLLLVCTCLVLVPPDAGMFLLLSRSWRCWRVDVLSAIS